MTRTARQVMAGVVMSAMAVAATLSSSANAFAAEGQQTTSSASLDPTAPAGQPAPVGVTLRCDAVVPVDALLQAKIQVLRIFRVVGLQVAWYECAPPSEHMPREPGAEHATTRAPLELTIVIVPRSMADRLQPDDENIGMAPGTATARGRLAYVFYDRVESLSEYFSTAIGQVLGGALAHEIGHLLLPYHSHSRTGLMRATWVSEDFQKLARGWLLFTPEHAALMRARLAQ
jgi:hypothetical protein